MFNKSIRVGNFEYKDHGLKLGDSIGNHFVIALQHVKAESEQVFLDAMESIKNNGFINYFGYFLVNIGMQRFGTRSLPTYIVGIEMLAERFENAVDIIMGLCDGERQDIVKAREHWKVNKDPEEALKMFPYSCIAERAILNSYKSFGLSNHLQALQNIPSKLRLLYLHSYQSYIWNHMASKRIELYGLKAVSGDLVSDGTSVDRMINVKVINQQEAANYSIFDIVLPLPGHSVIYPDNLIQEYNSILKKDGFDPYQMSRKHKYS
jgi:tRNA pseudouridine13 synthase